MSTYTKQDLGPIEDEQFFNELNGMIVGLCKHAPHPISALANVSSLMFDQLSGVNWCGFYLYDGSKLVVGPFQGKPACTEIALDRGVCGKAASTLELQRVDDVDAFEGHIACDGDTKSEIVVPITGSTGKLVGVLDIDSPSLARFSSDMESGFAQIGKSLSMYVDWDRLLS